MFQWAISMGYTLWFTSLYSYGKSLFWVSKSIISMAIYAPRYPPRYQWVCLKLVTSMPQVMSYLIMHFFIQKTSLGTIAFSHKPMQYCWYYPSHCWLVVWNMNFMFPYIGNLVIPTDFHIFQRGRYTTNQVSIVHLIVLHLMFIIVGRPNGRW